MTRREHHVVAQQHAGTELPKLVELRVLRPQAHDARVVAVVGDHAVDHRALRDADFDCAVRPATRCQITRICGAAREQRAGAD
jgi:soluble P-type ATPase